jgi:hypothetical protein
MLSELQFAYHTLQQNLTNENKFKDGKITDSQLTITHLTKIV